METNADRREANTARMPFDAIVELGGVEGSTFEAQAIDISSDGMHLRTAYLPEIGQALSCRFEAGPSEIVCEADVVWRQEVEAGGEFGLRFTNLDEESLEHLQSILESKVSLEPGAKIKLHIQGLGSPMKARVRDSEPAMMTAFSELGFLKIGKDIALEDVVSGKKRPARVHDVSVEVNPESNVPQLVIGLRYEGQENATLDQTDPEPHQEPAAKMNAEKEEPATDDEPFKSPFAKTISKVTPALVSAANRTRDTFATWMKTRRETKKTEEPLPRRTTAPPPTGALHTNGRKVFRESVSDEKTEVARPVGFIREHKRKLAVGGFVGLATVLGASMFHKTEPTPVAQTQATPETTSAVKLESAVVSTPANAPGAPNAQPTPMAMVPDQITAAPPQSQRDEEDLAPTKKPMPFGHGNVTNGKVISFKMDGPIGKIQGAVEPTGFTVVIPKRKSMTAAGPLAKKDARIATMKVANEASGAELNVVFKDGVPPYVVRANKDTLEVVLGQTDPDKTDKADKVERASAKSHGHHKKNGHHKKH